MAPKERLPDSAPFPTFFLPNFLGILFALGLESWNVEQAIENMMSENANKYSLLGLGLFAVSNVISYLGGSVILARIQYNVKLPNLYATGNDKNAIEFNCVQRGHQNFIETYAHVVLTVLFTAMVADRPNIAGFMLLVIAACRIQYAMGYKSNIINRMTGQLIAVFTMSIGTGYGFLVGVSAFEWILIE